MPQPVFFFAGKLVIWFVYGKSAFAIETDKPAFPFSHFLATPALYTAFIDTLRTVRDDEMWVYTLHISPPLTGGTGAHRRVEGKELVGRLCRLIRICLRRCAGFLPVGIVASFRLRLRRMLFRLSLSAGQLNLCRFLRSDGQ